MKKIGLGVYLVAITSVSVCAMSKPAQSAPAQQVESKAEAVAIQNVSSKIPVQLRGYLLSDLPKAMAKTVSPKDRVDVLMSMEAVLKDQKKSSPITVTLLQNIEVLEVGTDGEKAYLMVALSPRDAQYLALAQQQGKISVILRSPGDEANYLMEIATFDKLFN